jgi:hypothetical protein
MRTIFDRLVEIRDHERHEVVREGIVAAASFAASQAAPLEPLSLSTMSVPDRIEPRQHGERATETTEVHVHIGRIDVIATPEPATPRKTRAAPPRQTRSLGDYLSKGKRA